MGEHSIQLRLIRSDCDTLRVASFSFVGAIGMVHPEGKHGFGARLFSAYIGGARPLVQKNDRVYQPNRPAVRIILKTILAAIKQAFSTHNDAICFSVTRSIRQT